MSRKDEERRREYRNDETSIQDDVDIHDGVQLLNRVRKPYVRKERQSSNGSETVWNENILPPQAFNKGK